LAPAGLCESHSHFAISRGGLEADAATAAAKDVNLKI